MNKTASFRSAGKQWGSKNARKKAKLAVCGLWNGLDALNKPQLSKPTGHSPATKTYRTQPCYRNLPDTALLPKPTGHSPATKTYRTQPCYQNLPDTALLPKSQSSALTKISGLLAVCMKYSFICVWLFARFTDSVVYNGPPQCFKFDIRGLWYGSTCEV